MDCVRVWYRDVSPMKASSNFFPRAGHADLSYVVNRFLFFRDHYLLTFSHVSLWLRIHSCSNESLVLERFAYNDKVYVVR